MDKSKLFSNHPGRIILEEFLAPRGISASRLASDIGVSARRIYELVQGQRSINADLAHRLAHYFGMSERYWLALQARHDRVAIIQASAKSSRHGHLRQARWRIREDETRR